MAEMLKEYAAVVGDAVVDQLKQLAERIHGIKIVHVNSTKEGGGVAEILNKLIPFQRELGLDSSWDIITGEPDFYKCTKNFHNGLQGNSVAIPENLLRVYEETNARTAEEMRDKLMDADVVFIHDPQPAALIQSMQGRRGKWVWRCHIDASRPYRQVWKYLKQFVMQYDASIFSLANFCQNLPHPVYIIPPSIDPLSDKNREIQRKEINSVYTDFGIDPKRPLISQISRFDLFKDPLGVISAYRMAKKFVPGLQLVLAGGGASDDPEGEEVLRHVREAAAEDKDIYVLLLPSDAHRTINALQRASDIVLQKSIKEGFGLTVTEAMWKGKPVIGGDTGGIRLQIMNYHTGFLVSSPEGAALKIRYLLQHRNRMAEIGENAREFALTNFLITRLLRDHLTLMVGLIHGAGDRIDLG